ncbi:hypothetical protein ABK046_21020 [Streptomyces caeruleatus]
MIGVDLLVVVALLAPNDPATPIGLPTRRAPRSQSDGPRTRRDVGHALPDLRRRPWPWNTTAKLLRRGQPPSLIRREYDAHVT